MSSKHRRVAIRGCVGLLVLALGLRSAGYVRPYGASVLPFLMASTPGPTAVRWLFMSWSSLRGESGTPLM